MKYSKLEKYVGDLAKLITLFGLYCRHVGLMTASERAT